jgi:holo-[acyl-carrier protein] synthase
LKIIGHGVDIVALGEFAALIQSSGELYLGRTFSELEITYAGAGPHRIGRLASRFAAKEAVLKAMGTGWITGISWKDIEVIHQASGAPTVKLCGEPARMAEALGILQFYLSLSRTSSVALASVIAAGAGG